jgi:hypothetical protein
MLRAEISSTTTMTAIMAMFIRALSDRVAEPGTG